MNNKFDELAKSLAQSVTDKGVKPGSNQKPGSNHSKHGLNFKV